MIRPKWIERSQCWRATAVLPLAGVILLLCSASATPDDLNPPGYRCANCATSAEWDFESAQPLLNIQPDGTSVPLKTGDFAPFLNAAFPASGPYPSGSAFGGCILAGGGISGGTDGCQLAFNVPNCIDEEPEKRLRLQVTYLGPDPTTDMFGFLGVPGSSLLVEEDFVAQVADTSFKIRPCKYFYQDWQFFPNPDWEQVVLNIPAATTIKQVVIDTISSRRRFCSSQIIPTLITSGQPTSIVILAEFPDGIFSIVAVQALFELVSGAKRQVIDVTELLIPFITEVTDTTGTIVIPGVVFPPGTQASFTFSILTEGDTAAGSFSIDELTIDIPE